MPQQIATSPEPMQPPQKVCAWCPDHEPQHVSHGICPACKAREFPETLTPSERERARREATMAVAAAMHHYIAVSHAGRYHVPALRDLTTTQQARLQAGALIGLGSVDLAKFLGEGK